MIKKPGFFLTLGFCIPIVFCSCAQRGEVLSVDFTTKQQWRYQATITIDGKVKDPDTIRTLHSELSCLLVGSPIVKTPQSLSAITTNVSINTNFLDTAGMENLRQQCDKRKFILSLQEGSIVMQDSEPLPVIAINGWDVYRNFARAIPQLPQRPIKPGFCWDRERSIPLATRFGNGIGHLFQSFVLDSVTTPDQNKRYAMVSWIFTYHIELLDMDSSAGVKDFPMDGKGVGHASFNLVDHWLDWAEVDFTVMPDSTSDALLSWSEKVRVSREE